MEPIYQRLADRNRSSYSISSTLGWNKVEQNTIWKLCISYNRGSLYIKYMKMAEYVSLFLLKKGKRSVKERQFYPTYVPTEHMFAHVHLRILFPMLGPNGQQYF